MEEVAEVQDDENVDPRKESNKKKAKTPAQLEALKEIYRVNKYPTEEIKSRLAQQLGLTEKQVTHWFCNRRVRDKRAPLKDEACGDGWQDHSSGVVLQDRGSGFGQDSYGSTKHGNCRPPLDIRDVESRSLHGQDSHSAVLTYELRGYYPGNIGVTDDMSSDSSSALQERRYSQSMDKYDMRSSRFVTSHGICKPASSNTSRDMQINYNPAGYLKVRGEIENAAITAVKRQLGRHYQEDGPPLGIEFQPLPPGAFESAGALSVFESYYDEDPALSYSPNIHQVCHPPSQKAKWQFYDPKNSSLKHYDDALNSSPMDRSDDSNYQPHFNVKQNCTFSGCSDHLAGTSSSLNMQEYFMGDVSVSGDGRNRLLSSRTTAKIIGSNHRLTSHMRAPWHDEYESENMGPEFTQSSKKLGDKLRGPVVSGGGPTDAEGGGPSKRISKVKHHGGGEASNGHFNLARETARPRKEMTAVKQMKNEVPTEDYYAFSTPPDLPPWSYHAKGYTAEIEAHLSGDEIAGTSSSLE